MEYTKSVASLYQLIYQMSKQGKTNQEIKEAIEKVGYSYADLVDALIQS